MASLLVNNETVKRILNDAALKKSIPCLTNVQVSVKKKSSCSSCPNKQRDIVTVPETAVKKCLTTLSPEQLAEVKKALNVEQLMCYFSDVPGMPPRVVL